MVLCRMQDCAEFGRTVERRAGTEFRPLGGHGLQKRSSDSRRLITKAQVGVLDSMTVEVRSL
jgi:hypothetical protein